MDQQVSSMVATMETLQKALSARDEETEAMLSEVKALKDQLANKDEEVTIWIGCFI